jgi:hypothetical protein
MYLSIAECCESPGDQDRATESFQVAIRCAGSLPDEVYFNMIHSGIDSNMARVRRA